MGQRLADGGYYVLLPDMFWRAGRYAPINMAPINMKEAMRDDESRRAAFGKLRGSTDQPRQDADTRVFIDWLLSQTAVRGPRVGVTGYCMGAGKVAAAAGFHGGRLATDAPDSPHLLAPLIRAKVYVGGADEDAGLPVEQADRLRAALTAAGAANTVEIYAGARHGYVPRDMPACQEEAAERHWRELFKLLAETLAETQR